MDRDVLAGILVRLSAPFGMALSSINEFSNAQRDLQRPLTMSISILVLTTLLFLLFRFIHWVLAALDSSTSDHPSGRSLTYTPGLPQARRLNDPVGDTDSMQHQTSMGLPHADERAYGTSEAISLWAQRTRSSTSSSTGQSDAGHVARMQRGHQSPISPSRRSLTTSLPARSEWSVASHDDPVSTTAGPTLPTRPLDLPDLAAEMRAAFLRVFEARQEASSSSDGSTVSSTAPAGSTFSTASTCADTEPVSDHETLVSEWSPLWRSRPRFVWRPYSASSESSDMMA